MSLKIIRKNATPPTLNGNRAIQCVDHFSASASFSLNFAFQEVSRDSVVS